jgi:carnitine 3-dehydrogenase
VSDVDAAVSWGPGLRWGIMGPNLLYHLGGGAGGIEHFFDQFTGPMSAWWKVLGNPVVTPEVRAAITKGVHEETHAHSIPELEASRDRVLLGLLELRKDEARVLGG